MTENNWYVCPVLINRFGEQNFSDYSLQLYPDSITRVIFQCNYNAQRYHNREYSDVCRKWFCCDSAARNSLGCCIRRLTDNEKIEISKGVVRRHESNFEIFILRDNNWLCCHETDEEGVPCGTMTLDANEYKEFFKTEWMLMYNSSYGFNPDYK